MIKNATEKYRKLPLPLKATVWFTVCQFLQKGISLLTSPFIARLLSTEEYGKASTFASWERLFLMLVTLSSFQAVPYLCVRFDNKKRVLSSLIGYNITVAAIWGIIFLFGFKGIVYMTGFSSSLILCMYLYCVFSSFISCWLNVKMYDYSYKPVFAEMLLSTFGTAVGGLAAILFISKTAEAKIVPQVIFTCLIGFVIVINAFNKEKVYYSKEVWKFTFCFCVPLLPHYLSEIILMSSDRIMIDRMCGASDVAIYSVAYTVGMLITMIASAINSAFVPYQCQRIAEKDYKTLAKNTNYIIAFVASCLCGIMLFGREVVLLFGGQKYIDSILLIIPISLGVFFNYVFQLFARVQEYFGQKHTIVIASVSCALLNIVLNYIFIRKYGYMAAAYTTFACYLIFCLLHYLFYRYACRKYVGQEIYDRKGLVLISTALIVASVVIRLISRLYILKYFILLFAFAIGIWQRRRIIDFVKTIRGK